jgi:uncharacterized protein YhaN
MSECINPDESLAELLSKKKQLQNDLIRLFAHGNNGDLDHFFEEKQKLDQKLQAVCSRINELEKAAHTPGQCIRLI